MMEINVKLVNGIVIGFQIPDDMIDRIQYSDCRPAIGDVNGDGNVDQQDAELVMAHLSGETVLESEQVKRADMDGDGEITYLDAMSIMEQNNNP